MKRTIMVQEEKHQDVSLGELKIPQLNVDIKYSSLVPYAKGREDLEVLLRYPNVLRDKQPIEINGFNSHVMLRRAVALREELQEKNKKFYTYEDLSTKHPIIVSYPPEVIWLAGDKGLRAWKKNFKQILPKTELGFEAEQIDLIIEKIITHVRLKPQTYHFWRAIINEKVEKESLSKIIMEWAIQNTINSRGKWISPLTPLIDQSTLGSINLSHRVNLAYSYLIDDKQDEGIKTPAPLYSIQLNSSIIHSDDWTDTLDQIVKNTRLALSEDKFDGIFLYIRGFKRISQTNGRVHTLMKLMTELNKIGKDTTLPTWYSRFGIAGLRALDCGCSFTSFPINISHEDAYVDGFPGEEMHKYGKVINLTKREKWNKDQVIKSKSGPDGGLPHLENYWIKNAPSIKEEESHFQWRIHFTKPYNIAAFSNLTDQWIKDIKAGETNPGKEFLKSFEAPYNNWSN